MVLQFILVHDFTALHYYIILYVSGLQIERRILIIIIMFSLVGGKVASMVEQFNKGNGKQQESDSRTIEITAPIMDYEPGMAAPKTSRSQSRSPERNLWKTNPIFGSNEEDDDDDEVPEIIKRLSQNGLPAGKQLSDTLSSDMIVNSISNGM